MAPVSPVKRVTRARAAATKTDGIDAPSKKINASKVTKSTTTRKAKPVVSQPIEEITEPKRTSRTTKTDTITKTITAAPRRRIKVTPLDVPEEVVPENPVEAAPKKTTRTKKTATAEEPKEEATIEKAPKTRTRSKPVSVQSEEKELSVPKTRGRPKKSVAEAEEPKAEPKTTRQTRTRAGSNVEKNEPAPTVSKPIVPRKKVTFQDLPEDDKENQPLAKKAASKKTTNASGIRAKPIRKPATTRKTATKESKEDAPKALTPKKITQVARSSTPEESDEDELNGAKTPVRNLSLSPKRLPNPTAPLSPVKKLDFTPALTNSPQKGMQSPARRPPSSPSKNLKESPQRFENGPIFPASSQKTTTVALAPTFSQSMLLQSPKRGATNESMFSQSAMKPPKSPLKASLLQSPARRLFSPAKAKTPATVPTKFKTSTPIIEPPVRDSHTPTEVTVSSHFRASVSPQRSVKVHRMSDEELAEELRAEIDFDDSVLNIRSPLKAVKPLVSLKKSLETLPTIENDLNQEEEAEDLYQSGIVEGEMDQEVDKIETEKIVVQDQPPQTIPSMSQILFRSSRFREDDESSEDELAADETPDRVIGTFRSSLTGATIKGRLSTGVNSRNIGFTPLAAQMSSWLANSPEKKQSLKPQHGLFSPVAAQHVPGEVQISRQSTPQQKRHSGVRQSMSASKMAKSPLGLTESPDKHSFFAEEMSATIFNEENENVENEIQDFGIELQPLAEASDMLVDSLAAKDDADDEDDESNDVEETPGDLTTDMINFTNASDTALVDFAQLAKEAEQLAPEAPTTVVETSGPEELENDQVSIIEEEPGCDLDLPTQQEELAQTEITANEPPEDIVEQETLQAPSDVSHSIADEVVAASADETVDDPDQVEINFVSSAESVYGDENVAPEEQMAIQDNGVHIEDEQDQDIFNMTSVSNIDEHDEVQEEPSSPALPAKISIEVTPVRPNISAARSYNTVISKVPLRPEGIISPIKMPKKRSLSFSNTGSEFVKRPNLGVPQPTLFFSPERRVRSAAPSPAHTTPGQMSFVIDDFGDSTLDGIELPEEEMGSDDEISTPATLKSVKSKVFTPSRTPLKAVGSGILHGAVVYVDVHTTEGADASGLFNELLTQMGAKCVKEWRWNPRASGAADATPGKIGITHIVYKDGGKRTLEKVRDTKGAVWCVGVAWVLDCERENKWLDESNYAIDQSVIPRGGSRRRKSMEPRALINSNGSLSAAKTGRRSFSAEMLTESIKQDLVNTPVRGVASSRESIAATIGDDESEISSTYNSPTTTLMLETSQPANQDMVTATPTGVVNYDPRTAMTPTTPYLMNQGSKLIQMSCPPKQTNRGIFDEDDDDENNSENNGFPISGNLDNVKDEKMKKKLMEARRKTLMGWRPKVGSPLAKN